MTEARQSNHDKDLYLHQLRAGSRRAGDSLTLRSALPIRASVIRHSFVLGYFVIPHSAAFHAVRSSISSTLLVVLGCASIGCASIRPPRNVEPVVRRMEATAYCSCGECCGWRRTWYGRAVYADGPNRGKPKQVGVTATGARARRGTIAADTTRYPFGTIMQIDGYGYGRVEDRGGAIKGDHIDLFFPSHHDAIHWGKRHLNVRVWFMPSLRGELFDLESFFAAMEESVEHDPATAD